MNATQINFADTISKGVKLSFIKKIIATNKTNIAFLVSIKFYKLAGPYFINPWYCFSG